MDADRDEKRAFDDYLSQTFPEDKKRTRSAVIHRSLAHRIIDEDKAFRHYVKKTGFSLLNLPTAGVHDVLVVAIKEEKQIS